MIPIGSLNAGHETHPGEMLADELKTLNISQQDFARQIGMQKSHFNEIIKGKRNINAETAILISKALGGSIEFWLNAQRNYDLDKAHRQRKVQERSVALDVWSRFKNLIAVSYLRAQKLLTGDPVDDVPAIRKLFKIETPEDLEQQVCKSPLALFRKSQRFQEDKINIFTWVKMVEYQASIQHVPPFNKNSTTEVVSALQQIILKNVNVIDSVQHILNRQGIKFIYQPKAEKAPIDGMSCWSGENPAIGVSLRSSRLDNFAFTLLHELGHVYMHLAHDFQTCFYDNIDDPANNQQEKEANIFAQENLLPESEWQYLQTSSEYFNQDYILRFAKQVGRHPAIIAGQVCHKTGHYKWRRSEIENAIG